MHQTLPTLKMPAVCMKFKVVPGNCLPLWFCKSRSNMWHDPKKFCASIGDWTPAYAVWGEHHTVRLQRHLITHIHPSKEKACLHMFWTRRSYWPPNVTADQISDMIQKNSVLQWGMNPNLLLSRRASHH